MNLTLILILFIVIGLAVMGVITARAVHNTRVRMKNAASPAESVVAVDASKHYSVTTQRHPIAGDPTGGHGYHTIHSVEYTAVFRTGDGTELELQVDQQDYDALPEGSAGTLTYQGTRCLQFTPLDV